MRTIEFNTINYYIFSMPPYLFFALLGVFLSLSVFLILLFKEKLNVKLYFRIVLLTIPFVMFGAIALGVLYGLIRTLILFGEVDLSVVTKTGIVFYGGLTGFILSFIFLCKVLDIYKNVRVYDVIAVCIPFFHTFARIGCFTAGCCYGIESDSFFGLKYTNMIDGNIVTENRIPTQLIESFFNLVLFLLLIILLYKRFFWGFLLYIYLLLYSIYRLFAELLRGDWNRDAFILSPSQIYSILIILIVIYLLIRNKFYKYIKHRGKITI